jgi:hypothetical protein
MEGKRARDENLFENPEWVKKEYHASQAPAIPPSSSPATSSKRIRVLRQK